MTSRNCSGVSRVAGECGALTRVVDEDVDLTKLLNRRVDHDLRILGSSDIGRDDESAPTALFHESTSRRQAIGAPTGQDDVCSGVRRERTRGDTSPDDAPVTIATLSSRRKRSRMDVVIGKSLSECG